MTFNREEKWACWNALLDGIARTYDEGPRVIKRSVVSAFAKVTAELGDVAVERLGERIAHERIHNLPAMYALQDARKEGGIA